ncbi:hypothetical protein FSP39_019545 [Pinctada imbricata]|uniref:Uncharacterized protein n=1 Tax=Pinctada imbricata TaxID=66713 RepID=A0AA88YEF3_PINIB|nr:hypothetical protein FSP39_019545 [Pinctada imbricata]
MLKVLEPCLPCYYSCSVLNCDPLCNADVNEVKTFTLNGIDLPPKQLVTNSTGHSYYEVNTYYLTVRATLGSGAEVTASSDGFYIDDTPPVFDLDIMEGDFYVDVNQGPLTPVRFSSSNSTIKAFWSCEDTESEIIEYLWAIGTSPGSEDVQLFTSTGKTASGTNSSFEGLLTHESVFYVSVICKNGAGNQARFNDTKGLTILLLSPNASAVATSVAGSADFPQPVVPADAKIGTDPTSLGFSFTILDDESVDRYDMCLGSSENLDDIFPCTWVGYNESGEVKIMDGAIYVNGKVLSRLSEVKAFDPNQTDADRAAPENNVFRMEPGRTVFLTMRVCNKAVLCSNKSLGTLTMASQGAVFKKSEGGAAIDAIVQIPDGGGRKRRTAQSVEILTPRLADGQALLVEPLTEQEMNTTFGSASSTNFQPYIVNPSTTTDLTERLLYKRIKGYSYSFTVVPVGHLSMPGPMSISFSDSIGPVKTGLRNMLLHLNPGQQKWEITSRLCTELDTALREVWDNQTSTMTVKVCDTWRDPNAAPTPIVTVVELTTPSTNSTGNDTSVNDTDFSNDRRRRAVDSGEYYHSETQFIVATVDAEVYNSPPELNVSAYVTMQEDQGTLVYQLVSVDEEGDPAYYRLDNTSTISLGTANISESGLLMFTPCSGCFGNTSIDIEIYELQTDPDIPPASSIATIYVNITEINDPPVAFLARDGVYLLENDVTEPVALVIEQMTDIYWLIGAYDQEGDQITMYMEHPTTGNITIQSNTTTTPNFTHCANTSLISGDRATLMPCDSRFTTFPLSADQMSWLIISFSYMSETYGNDTFKIYFKDSRNALSYTVTVKLLIASSACISDGNCDNLVKDKSPVSYFPIPYAGSPDYPMDGDDTTCFITYKSPTSYFIINMEKRQSVDAISLVFRPQHAYRFTPFTLYLSNTANYQDGTICYEYTDQSKLPKEADIYSCVGSGQYVIMRVDRSGVIPPNWRPDDPYASMSLCEISVSSPSGGGYSARANLAVAEGVKAPYVSLARYIGSPVLITDEDVDTCYITYSTKQSAELVLNLGSSQAIKRVRIVFRPFHSYCLAPFWLYLSYTASLTYTYGVTFIIVDSYRLAPFWLYLSNTPNYPEGNLCYKWEDTNTIPAQDGTYACEGTAQYVILRVDRSGSLPQAWRNDDPRTSLSLCEFEVLNY